MTIVESIAGLRRQRGTVSVQIRQACLPVLCERSRPEDADCNGVSLICGRCDRTAVLLAEAILKE